MRRAGILGLFAGAVVLAGVVAPAMAEPSYPSEAEVDEARRAERSAEAAVAALEGRLAAADHELDQLYVRSAKAVEAYNGARLQLAEAEAAERAARSRASRAAAEADQAQADLGRLAAATYASGGDLSSLGLVLEARDGAALYDGVAALRSVTASQAGIYERSREATAAAEGAAVDAADALARRSDAADAARSALEAAEAAVDTTEAAAAAIEGDRDALLAELAAARGTSADLERRRQAGLAAEEAAERERRAGDDPPDSGPPTSEPTVEPTPPGPTPTPTTSPSSSPTATPTPTATPPPPPPPPPPKPDGAEAAIAYAYAQLGKPYEWGADGPDSFDCSGLTMRAWAAGGVELPHWSVAQAREVTRVSYAQLRPGDLIFWSDNGEASGVYHVGLYIGDGQMIHAPRPGKNVEVQSVFYWVDPAFYGRV